MLEHVTAVEFRRRVSSGRTGPCQLLCEKADGTPVEVFAKFSAGCDEGETNLAREVLAACLAADLELPVPVPYLVAVPDGWADSILDTDYSDKVKASSTIAFGSGRVANGFSAWITNSRISDALAPTAAAIFAFDAIIQNPDRRNENPNCLVRGDEIRIIDHELSFVTEGIVGWKPPWSLGSLQHLKSPGRHIFYSGLQGRSIDWEAFRVNWGNVLDERLETYENSVPNEWEQASVKVKRSLELIAGARDNIDACLHEITRVLS